MRQDCLPNGRSDRKISFKTFELSIVRYLPIGYFLSEMTIKLHGNDRLVTPFLLTPSFAIMESGPVLRSRTKCAVTDIPLLHLVARPSGFTRSRTELAVQDHYYRNSQGIPIGYWIQYSIPLSIIPTTLRDN